MGDRGVREATRRTRAETSGRAALGFLGAVVPAMCAFLLVLGGWWMVGDPRQAVAARLWVDGPAPWERVTAVYIPDVREPELMLVAPGFRDLAACRLWVYREAIRRGDDRIRRGDWHCRVGAAGAPDHRLTLR